VPTPPHSRKAKATYGSLVDAARDSVKRAGILLPEAVAEAAGVSPATLYTYFSSKDALLAAAFDAAQGELGETLIAVLNIERLLEEGLESVSRRLVRAVIRRLSQDARVFRLALARLPESPELTEAYRRRDDEQLATIGRFIKLGQAANKVRDGNGSALSRALVVQLHALADPMVLNSAAGPVVEEIGRVVFELLSPPRSTFDSPPFS